MKRILFFCYHYPPDQSAGAYRASLIVEALLNASSDLHVHVISSIPRRYNRTHDRSSLSQSTFSRLSIHRIWSPNFGSSLIGSALSYLFFSIGSASLTLSIRPSIVVGTSAKLFTSLVSAICAKLVNAPFFLDVRDTFADNFFYFYRWNKRIILQSVILVIENIVLRSACSINLVSTGFRSPFYGFERLLRKYNIELTFFPNSLPSSTIKSITSKVYAPYSTGAAFSIVYAGNLGEGQDLHSLLADFLENPETAKSFAAHNFSFNIYGAGSQSQSISKAIESLNLLTGEPHFFFHGLLERSAMPRIYSEANCLMLQLGSFNSLSHVIPTKSLEYTCTPLPIIYGASGFAADFLSGIDGTIRFIQSDSSSFLSACISSANIEVSVKSRAKFLESFTAESNYRAYAEYMLAKL